MLTEWQQRFEAIWEDREERKYRALFGNANGDSIWPLDAGAFQPFGARECDPRWFHHGVFEFEPSPQRETWAYVSSGLSNPWDDEVFCPQGDSGLGMEFVIETTRQAPWAIGVLRQVIAYQLLLAAGHFGERPLLGPWHRLPPRCPIDGSEGSPLTALLVVPALELPTRVALDSGGFDLLHIIGITTDEHAYACAHGSDALLSHLVAAQCAPVSDPERISTTPCRRQLN